MIEINTPSDLAAVLKEVTKVTQFYVDLAGKKLGIHIPMPRILFSIKGRTAGRAWIGRNTIEFNPTLIRLNPNEFLERTPGHEVAHLAAHAKYPSRAIKAHGAEWRNVMWGFGLPAERCHNYEMDPHAAPKKPVPVRTENGLIIRPCGIGKIVELD
jgi:SprT protein